MPNDAKLGLVVGVGLVITVAVVFFRKDQMDLPSPAADIPTSSRNAGFSPSVSNAGQRPPIETRTPTRNAHAVVSDYQHTVREGDTLFSLAERFYGDRDRFLEIYQVNRETLHGTDSLTPGMVLTIPKVANASVEGKSAP